MTVRAGEFSSGQSPVIEGRPMYDPHPPRAVSAATSLALTAGVVAVLVLGFGAEQVRQAVPALVSVELGEPPPPPPPPRPKERPEKRTTTRAAPKNEEGARNLRNVATPIVAPPVVPLIVPPPVVVAPIANTGSAAQTGASNLPGSGQGAGLSGNGLGGGGLGGDGDGTGDGQAVQGPRRTSGTLSFGDLPEGTLAMGQEASVRLTYTIEANGRISRCEVSRPSGVAAIDANTCRWMQQRFRYRPALDRRGRPVRAEMQSTQTFVGDER